MSVYKQVLIAWHDEPEVEYLVTVSIDKEWNLFEETDDSIFFYFAKESEYEEAKQEGDNGLEFRIVKEINT